MDALRQHGELVRFKALRERLLASIEQRLAQLEPSWRLEFSSYLCGLLDHRGDGQALLLPSCAVTGELSLDFNGPLADVVAVCVFGDLQLHGPLINADLNDGIALFVEGSLSVDALFKGGSIITVLGDLQARDIVLCDYNDGLMRVGGALSAEALIRLDHDVWVVGETSGRQLDYESAETFVPELTAGKYLNGERIWQRYREGLPLFRSPARPHETD